MLDLAPLCILGLFLLLAFWMMSRMMRYGGGGNPYGRSGGAYPDETGRESPTYDSPDIESRGSFGRDRGAFPSLRRKSGPPSGSSGRTFGLGGRRNDPNIRSRGGFGRDRN